MFHGHATCSDVTDVKHKTQRVANHSQHKVKKQKDPLRTDKSVLVWLLALREVREVRGQSLFQHKREKQHSDSRCKKYYWQEQFVCIHWFIFRMEPCTLGYKAVTHCKSQFSYQPFSLSAFMQRSGKYHKPAHADCSTEALRKVDMHKPGDIHFISN